MKKVKKTNRNELRAEYRRSDFPKGFVRGKYAERLREASNVVVLEPEVARAFPNPDCQEDGEPNKSFNRTREKAARWLVGR